MPRYRKTKLFNLNISLYEALYSMSHIAGDSRFITVVVCTILLKNATLSQRKERRKRDSFGSRKFIHLQQLDYWCCTLK